MNDLVCDHFGALIIGANRYISNLFIQRIAFMCQRFQVSGYHKDVFDLYISGYLGMVKLFGNLIVYNLLMA